MSSISDNFHRAAMGEGGGSMSGLAVDRVAQCLNELVEHIENTVPEHRREALLELVEEIRSLVPEPLEDEDEAEPEPGPRFDNESHYAAPQAWHEQMYLRGIRTGY